MVSHFSLLPPLFEFIFNLFFFLGGYAYLSYVAITLYRLFNEVWSNALVVATFYSDEPQTQNWWLAVVFSVFIPCCK